MNTWFELLYNRPHYKVLMLILHICAEKLDISDLVFIYASCRFQVRFNVQGSLYFPIHYIIIYDATHFCCYWLANYFSDSLDAYSLPNRPLTLHLIKKCVSSGSQAVLSGVMKILS